jgi:hypothetical protein
MTNTTNAPTVSSRRHSGHLLGGDAQWRMVKTNLTDKQFGDLGLLMCQPSNLIGNMSKFVGTDYEGPIDHPILFQTQYRFADPVSPTNFGAVLLTSKKAAPAWIAAFGKRMSDLVSTAIEDGIDRSAKSEKDVREFVAKLRGMREPVVGLVGNGNYRLQWTNAVGECVGLQFRGKGEVQYLFFKRDGDRMEHMMGTKLIANVESFIATCGLHSLIAAR